MLPAKTCLVCLLAFMLVSCTEGPHYRILSIHSRAGADEMIFARYWQRHADVIGMTTHDRYDYFAAPFDEEQAGPAHLVARGGWQEAAEFFPSGRRCWLGAFKGDSIGFWIFEPDLHQRHKLDESDSPRTTAWAVTADRRHLLVVDNRDLRVIETESGKVIERTTGGSLDDAHRVIVNHFGAAGTWFITDDLHQVVIVPPDWVYEPGVTRSPEPVTLHAAGIRFVAGREGLICHRLTGEVRAFPVELSMPDRPLRYRVVLKSAAVFQGELLLVYVGADELGNRVVVVTAPDLANQHIGEVPFQNPDLFALVYVDVVPERRQVRLLECARPQARPGGSGFSPDFYLRSWSYDTDTVDVQAFTGGQVKQMVAQVKTSRRRASALIRD